MQSWDGRDSLRGVALAISLSVFSQRERASERPEALFREPLAKYFLRLHAQECGVSEYFLFIDEAKEFEQLPPGSYQRRQARRIYEKYLRSTTACVSFPLHLCFFSPLPRSTEHIMKCLGCASYPCYACFV